MDAKFNECRSDDLVAGFERVPLLEVGSGMSSTRQGG